MKIYYNMFEKLSGFQIVMLNVAVLLETVEYAVSNIPFGEKKRIKSHILFNFYVWDYAKGT